MQSALDNPGISNRTVFWIGIRLELKSAKYPHRLRRFNA